MSAGRWINRERGSVIDYETTPPQIEMLPAPDATCTCCRVPLIEKLTGAEIVMLAIFRATLPYAR